MLRLLIGFLIGIFMPHHSMAVTTEVNVEGATPDYDVEDDYSPEELEALETEELEALEAGDFGDFDTDSLLDSVDTSLFEDIGDLGGGLLDSFDI
jgi:hypothetical protein